MGEGGCAWYVRRSIRWGLSRIREGGHGDSCRSLAAPPGETLPKAPVVRFAYFDCFSGISGDMALRALIHAGADLDEIAKALSAFPIEDLDLAAEEVDVRGMPALTIHVHAGPQGRSEEHTSELQSRENLVCRLLLEKKK